MPERTFAFVDLAGFTVLTEIHGDEDAADLVERFEALSRQALGADDQVVKCVGDAVILASPDLARGIALLQRRHQAIAVGPNFPLPRTGTHHGDSVERNPESTGRTGMIDT